jgi:hypothetical protein
MLRPPWGVFGRLPSLIGQAFFTKGNFVSAEHAHSPCLPYEARTQAEIMSLLKKEGVVFDTMDMVSEGDYAPDDAAWNYMDIPHLTYVHKQVDGYLTLAADAISASVFFQNVPFARFPLTVLIYQTSRNSITYYTSFFFFLLIIETRWEEVASLRTCVTTRYAIGSTSWLVRLGFPLVKWLLRRNYRILMSEDIPMRDWRGKLRRWGYEFKMNGPVPSFLDSKKIMQANVIVPEQNVIASADVIPWGQETVRFQEIAEGERRFIGPSNHLGLSVVRMGDQVLVYPRLCPHEGASLDDNPPAANCTVMCPWHGRKFRPIVTIDLPARPKKVETPWHRYLIDHDSLTIVCKPNDSSLRHADWSRPAA